jgi:hypothetical protein
LGLAGGALLSFSILDSTDHANLMVIGLIQLAIGLTLWSFFWPKTVKHNAAKICALTDHLCTALDAEIVAADPVSDNSDYDGISPTA